MFDIANGVLIKRKEDLVLTTQLSLKKIEKIWCSQYLLRNLRCVKSAMAIVTIILT